MTYIGAIGRRIRLGDKPPGPCSASSGRGHLVPAPCSRARGLASLALGGAAAEPSPSLDTSSMVVDPLTPASTSGTAVDPPTLTDS